MASRLPISFSDAGFASQADYDAAKAGPQTPLAGAAALAPGQASFGGGSVFGAGATALPTSPSQQAAQVAANATASRLPTGAMPAVMGWVPGVNRSFTQRQGRLPDGTVYNLPGSVMTKDTSEGDAFVARHDQQVAQQTADAKTRAGNIAAAKALPESDPNHFSFKRAAFNQANAGQHMDMDGNIVQTTRAQKDHFTTLDAADASARAAQVKAAAVKSAAVSKLAADENKAEKERQKAVADAAKNSPAAVSQRLVKIMGFDAAESPIMTPVPGESPIMPAPQPSPRLLPILNAFRYPKL